MADMKTGLKDQKDMLPAMQERAEACRFRAYWERIGQLQAEDDWKETRRAFGSAKRYLGGLEVG